jgi:peptidoglycan/xylan/chitin deacetylase (PgdA/CDA1 family)
MHRYFIKTPWLVKKIFSNYEWNFTRKKDVVYLTFDDGPHPVITPWVLDQLKSYDAKASFFCIGNNVKQYAEVYNRIIEEGHAVGNHTFHHLNGWQTSNEKYLDDVNKASELIHTNLFRPPYGKIRASQAIKIADAMHTDHARIIMWDVLSADFDLSISTAQCLNHVVRHTRAGSIIVFHDSEKAFKHLEELLPATLEFLKKKGLKAEKISG